MIITCTLKTPSNLIENTEEALKKYVIVSCSDEIGTKYIYEFIWKNDVGIFIGIPRLTE